MNKKSGKVEKWRENPINNPRQSWKPNEKGGTVKITIRDVRVILTAPAGINLIVVKIETSEPGLYGLGCATFTQRWTAVAAAITEHLRPLLVGREVDRIEEIWQLMYQHSYWRNSPVLNNAIASVDIALWDIKGKRAGMPIYDLLGGKVREGAAVYRHADAADLKLVEERIHGFLADGVRHIRVQIGSYGGFAQRRWEWANFSILRWNGRHSSPDASSISCACTSLPSGD